MIVWCPLLWHPPKREPIQNVVSQEQIFLARLRAEHSCTSSLDAFFKLFSVAAKHQLEELGNRFGILPDLSLGPSIQNGKTSVDMPFVGVDTKHNIAFYVLNTANVAVDLPRKLIIGEPCGAHTQESGMSDSLCIRCNSVMLLGSQIDHVGIEARENVLD